MSVRLYLTDRDQKVLKFVEQYGSTTISQTQKMFYNTQKYGYDIARRRLRKMVVNNKLKVSRDPSGNENVYYTEKKLNYHDLLVLDYYAELIYQGAQVVYFKRNQPWLGGKYISDAYCCYVLGRKVFFNIIEVVRTHKVDNDKYLKLIESGEPQRFNSIIYEKLGGKPINEFPRLIIIDNVEREKEVFIHSDVMVYNLDFKLRGFSKIFA